MEQKKPTNAQLQRRIKNAVIHVDRTKDTKEIYFSDKGLRLIITDDTAIIETGFHRHIFNSFCTAGMSRPFMYTQRLVDIALENDCKTEQGYSYVKLMEVLKAKEDKAEYNITTYVDWWLYLIFNNLYSIAEDETSSWLVYFKYIQSIAMNSIILDEHKEDVTNKQFVERFKKMIDEFTENVDERVVFHALSDEERMKQEIEAIQENESNKLMQQDAMEAQQHDA